MGWAVHDVRTHLEFLACSLDRNAAVQETAAHRPNERPPHLKSAAPHDNLRQVEKGASRHPRGSNKPIWTRVSGENRGENWRRCTRRTRYAS